MVGLTGLFGSSERSFALMFGALDFFGGAVRRGAGAAVGGTAIGRCGALRPAAALPRGPGDAPPLGAGLGAVPAVRVTAVVLVALGFGTPVTGAGVLRAMAAGAVEGLGTAGAGVAGRKLGCVLGCGGRGVARAAGAAEAAGEGTAVGGGLTDTAIGPMVGMLTGAAGTALAGRVSKMFCVGWGFGCGVVCGIGRGLGGALGAVFASSCRLTGSRCAWGTVSGACCGGAICRTCGTGSTARVADG